MTLTASNISKRLPWAVQATRDLGFPIVVALVLLLKMPSWIKDAVGADAAVRAEQHHALIEAFSRSSRAFEGTTAALSELTTEARELRSSADTIRGMVIGKLKCPQCPQPHSYVVVPQHSLLARVRQPKLTFDVHAVRTANDVEDHKMERELSAPIPTIADFTPIHSANVKPATKPHVDSVRALEPYECGLPWERLRK